MDALGSISWACICYSACMEVGVFLAACYCTCMADYLWAPMEFPVFSSHLVLEVGALQILTAAQALCGSGDLRSGPHTCTQALYSWSHFLSQELAFDSSF